MSDPQKIYRICTYDALRHELSADLIEAGSDDEAIASALAAGFGTLGELWDGTRLVVQLKARAA